MNINELLELYKITLDELRQHRTIYVQSFIGLGIILPIFLAAISFMFSGNVPIREEYIIPAKSVLTFLAVSFTGFYFWTLMRYDKRLKACIETRRTIEDRLKAERPDLEELLVGSKIERIRFEKFWTEKRFCIYIICAVLLLVVFGIFLFLCIA